MQDRNSSVNVQNCTFCQEFLDIENSEFRSYFSRSELPTRIIASSENFICLAALGAIREGYLLILPKGHIPSFAFLEHSFVDEAQGFLNSMIKLASLNFSNPIVFEHGAMDEEELTGGSCIDHAHIHVFPSNINLFEKLAGQFQYRIIHHIKDLSSFKFKKQPYLYYQKGNKGFAFLIDKQIPSQYIRRIVWAEENKPDEWDWSVFVGKEHVIETVRRLKNAEI